MTGSAMSGSARPPARAGASGRGRNGRSWPGDQVWQPTSGGNLWEDWGRRRAPFFRGPTSPTSGKRLQFGGGLAARINANLSFYANADYEFAVGNTDGGKRDGVRGALGLGGNW